MKRILKNNDQCCGCGACTAICPKDAIIMKKDTEGFLYPMINEACCVDCKQCQNVCQMMNATEIPEDKTAEAFYGAKALNEDIRFSSSSGGVFSILAKRTIDDGGYVCAAVLDEMTVRHIVTKDYPVLKAMQKTKYVQSDINGVYQKIGELLGCGERVMFAGTPCQCAGIKKYSELKLGAEKTANLMTVDLVCYGVPSPGFWKDYIQWLERKHKGKVTSFSFRDKRAKDNGHTVAYTVNGQEYTVSLSNNEYCKIYFKNLIIRPSCHDCRYCTVKRTSDITIGDFWGIEKVRQDILDGMGTSLVIVHTQRGAHIVDEVKDQLMLFEVKEEQALQPRLKTPTDASPKRELFMKMYRYLPFSWIMKIIQMR